jgi:hypothetical protein
METEFYIRLTHRKQERISNKHINKFRNVKECIIRDSMDKGNTRGMINFGKKQIMQTN